MAYKKTGNPVGRPLKYKSAEEMQILIDKYFEDCDNYMFKTYDEEGNEVFKHQPKPYTITGLGLALNLSRQDLLQYQGRKEFADTVKRAKQRCENYAEEQLFRQGNTAGVIFNLKNNYGYKDKQEVEAEVSQTIKITPPKFD